MARHIGDESRVRADVTINGNVRVAEVVGPRTFEVVFLQQLSPRTRDVIVLQRPAGVRGEHEVLILPHVARLFGFLPLLGLAVLTQGKRVIIERVKAVRLLGLRVVKHGPSW